ncbi:MAG: hypothetical protein ACI9WU_004152 [Myxococcota bacterium]|jgi:hypothetical protein
MSNHMSKNTLNLVLGVTSLALWAGCGDADVVNQDGKNPGIIVETVVTPQILIQGQTANISCPVFDQAGVVQDLPTRFSVTPNVAPVDNQVTPTASGKYEVTCHLEDGSLFDVTPATLLVIGPDQGDDVAIDTLLNPAKVAIGEPSTASCGVAFQGQVVSGLNTDIEVLPTAGITIDDHVLTGQVDGDFDVVCLVPDTAFRDNTPARLVVGEGSALPAKITTILSPNTVVAGNSSSVSCTVTDASGVVLDLATLIEAPAGVAVVGNTLQGQQVGSHAVTCRLVAPESNPELLSATLTVTPGEPVSVEAWADPIKAVYKPADVIDIKWQGLDKFNNPVPLPPATITAPTQSVTTLGPAQFQLFEDAYLSFKVTLDSGPETTVEITVDGNGPELEITSPARGLTFDGDGTIVVTGTAADAFGGLKSLEINGIPVTTDELGNWSVEINSVHGVNPVVVTAADAHDNHSKTTVSWYYSTGWVTTDKALSDEAWLPDTVRVWFAQELIDDGDHTEAAVDDLAHLLEVLLTQVDVGEMLGKPAVFEQVYPDVVSEPNFAGTGIDLQGDVTLWAEIDSVVFGDATVSLTSREGGIDMDAAFVPNGDQPGMHVVIKVYLAFDLEGTLETTDPNSGFAFPFKATLSPPPTFITTATLTIDELDLAGGFDIAIPDNTNLTVNAMDVATNSAGWVISPLAAAELDLGSLVFWAEFIPVPGFPGVPIELATIQLGSVDVSSLFSGLNSLFQGLSSVILDNVEVLASEVLNPVVGVIGSDALKMAFESLEIEHTITTPQLVDGQPAVAVDVEARIYSIEFDTTGAHIGLKGRAIADKVVERYPLGTMLRDQCLGTDASVYELPKTGVLEFGLAIDLMNEVLHSMWWNGGLNMAIDAKQVDDLAPLNMSKADVTLSPLLPPVLTDCNSKGTLKMQLGDSHITADVLIGDTPVTFEAWLSAEIDVGVINTGADTVGIVVNGVSKFDIEVFNENAGYVGNEGAVTALLEDVLVQKLLGSLVDSALSSFPIPQFDIGGIVQGVPGSVVLALDGFGIKKSAGFLQIEGKLAP